MNIKIKDVVILFFFLIIRLAGYANPSAVPKPNVLFIVVDDLRPELGCYGKKHIYSPNIDRLARTGHIFTQAYVNFPVCGPSRASMMSGLYASRDRFLNWNCSQDKDVPGIVSLPMHFKNNGFETVSLGKVYNNFEDGRGSWDENWRPAPTTTAWDYQDKESIRIFENLNRERWEDTKPRNNHNLPQRGPAFEYPDVPDITYEDGIIATKAIEKLQEFKNNNKPFFLAVGFKKPHLPFNAPSKYWEIYDSLAVALPDNRVKPNGAPDLSLHNFSELRAYHNIPKEGIIPETLARKLIHGYYACVSYVDSQIGRVLNELEDLGLEENTVVVLVGDHGWQLGEYGLWCKHSNFKTSLQIPWIIRSPGTTAGIVQQGLVEAVDLYPTLCHLVGLPIPRHTQGKSIVKMLKQEEAKVREYIFSRSNLNGETIISEFYSYTEFFDKNGLTTAKMLYDLKNDPRETVNIVDLETSTGISAKLSRILHQHIEERDKILLNNY